MAPIALEMVRDINEDTVDFQPNYDGKSLEPTVLPARFPNLLVNVLRVLLWVVRPISRRITCVRLPRVWSGS